MAGALFKDEELRDIAGVVRGEDFVQVTCGCTSRKYGDAIGKLKIFDTGDLVVRCDCIKDCQEDFKSNSQHSDNEKFLIGLPFEEEEEKNHDENIEADIPREHEPVKIADGDLDIMTPSEFEKHTRPEEVQRRWKHFIWVIMKGKKVPLLKTALLKYYIRAEKASGLYKGHSARSFHRDEFICCTECKKERRFRLQTKEECRIYHDAIANPKWKCSDSPLGNISCEDDEERASRRAIRGCPRASLCKGCTDCVCFGCEICRFSDCDCRTCTDFITNADI